MKFKQRNLKALAEMVIGDNPLFEYRKSSQITEFFDECDLGFVHNGTTRWAWTADRLSELLQEPQPNHYSLPPRFVHVFRVLMRKSDAKENDSDRTLALNALNEPLRREGFEAYYAEDEHLYIRHCGTGTISNSANPHRPLTAIEQERKSLLLDYLLACSEDELITEVLLPLFRQLGFHQIKAAGHKDKSLEYGKDIWMRYTLPTNHFLYFGVQVKKDKLDAAGVSKSTNTNVAEIHHQLLMMLDHEIFDPETNRRCLVDHAIIVAGGEITKQAKNWLGEKLDRAKRSQVLFMDRDDIVNHYITCNLALPAGALPESPNFDDVPF